MSYIGLDVGTSGCKASVITSAGTITASADAQYSFTSPNPGDVELDPSIVFDSVKNVLKQISPYAKDSKTIAVSSIGESMVILDKKDQILYNGIIYLDQRCQNIPALIEAKISPQEIHHITGVSMNQMFTLNKFLWFRKYAPSVLEHADKYFLFGDYITYMLSGERAIDPGSASRTMFFDARTHQWSHTIAGLFDIPIDRFSTISSPGTKLGLLKSALAEELGLPKNLIVLTGIHDQCAATLGSGSLLPGDLMLGQGSTESINCVIHKNNLTSALITHEICFEPYIDEEHYLIITGNLTHGSSIDWFVRNLCKQPEQSSFDFSSLYKDLPSDSGDTFFLPYLSKVNLMNSKNHALGCFLGIDVTVTKPQLFRALLEGLCFETRTSLEIFEKISLEPKKIVASGGASKSSVYMQMKSDIIQFPIHILEHPQAGIMGLGIIGAVAFGDFPSYAEASQTMIKIHPTVYNPEENYQRKYMDYCTISHYVKNLYSELEHNKTYS